MSRKQRQVFSPILALIVLSVATIALVSVRATNSRLARRAQAINANEIPQSAVTVPVERGALQDSMEAELITILPAGFEPAEIRRPAGKFVLAIDNRSGLAEVNLSLLRVAGRSVQALRIKKETPDLREMIELAPGVYQLTEANHPDWSCRLTITEP